MGCITLAWNLLKGVHVKGAGTLVKAGVRGDSAELVPESTVERLGCAALLEESFGRTLDARFFDHPPAAVVLRRRQTTGAPQSDLRQAS